MIGPLVKTLASNAVEAPFAHPTFSVQPRHPNHGFVAKRLTDPAPEVIRLAGILTDCLFRVGAIDFVVEHRMIVTGIIRGLGSTYIPAVGIFAWIFDTFDERYSFGLSYFSLLSPCYSLY